LNDQTHQLTLFGESSADDLPLPVHVDKRDYGTFKDSLRAPIHSWFRYPAGFSNTFVEQMFARFEIHPGQWIYDPFSGTGTTLICAKQAGINGYGVEAHAFVHWIAQVKLFWEFDRSSFGMTVENTLRSIKTWVNSRRDHTSVMGVFPELIYKCYHPQDLVELYLVREFIEGEIDDPHLVDFLKVALTDTLRKAAAAGTGWPYIAPKKNTGDKPPKNALGVFTETARKMFRDIQLVTANPIAQSRIHNVLGDSREHQHLQDETIDYALTSPPYLNNYDYADRTRLETYFWGLAKTWGEITQQYRNQLLVAATTQVVRRQHDIDTVLNREIDRISQTTYATIQTAVEALASQRLVKAGKKDYDLMVALYFNGLLSVIREAYRVLKPGSKFCLVLGDSAPYGVYIATHELAGQLGVGLGFKRFDYEMFRARGDKWRGNPQRHHVELREGVVILTK